MKTVSTTMTPQFRQLLQQTNSPVIQKLLYTKFLNDIGAAKAVIELEKIMIDAIDKQNEMLKEMNDKLEKGIGGQQELQGLL